MDNPRDEKVAVVTEVRERFEHASAAILTEYRGLTVKDLAALRRTLRDAGSEYKIYKNTLVRFAARDAGLNELESLLVGPTAIAFVDGDAAAVAKALRDYARTNPKLTVKGGVLGKRIISVADATALADLPPREVVLARVAGALAAPLQTFAGLLQALPRSFAYGLKALIDKRGGPEAVEAAAAPDAEAAAPAGTPSEAPAPTDAEGTDAAEAAASGAPAAEAAEAAASEGTDAVDTATEPPAEATTGAGAEIAEAAASPPAEATTGDSADAADTATEPPAEATTAEGADAADGAASPPAEATTSEGADAAEAAASPPAATTGEGPDTATEPPADAPTAEDADADAAAGAGSTAADAAPAPSDGGATEATEPAESAVSATTSELPPAATATSEPAESAVSPADHNVSDPGITLAVSETEPKPAEGSPQAYDETRHQHPTTPASEEAGGETQPDQ